jgi:hypothetical protein
MVTYVKTYYVKYTLFLNNFNKTWRPVWTGAENLASTGIRSQDRLAHSESLCRLSYPDPDVQIVML